MPYLHAIRISDLFGKKGRVLWAGTLKALPPQSLYTTQLLMERLDQLDLVIKKIEKRMAKIFTPTPEMMLLKSLPGVANVLSVVIGLEVGDIRRFKGAAGLASYAGTVPRVHASGGKIRYGRTRSDVNHYLKWAYAEAGNSVALNHKRFPFRHVSGLYKRVQTRRDHATAIGAVGRHLAEATYWMLTKHEPYQERGVKEVQGAVSATLS